MNDPLIQPEFDIPAESIAKSDRRIAWFWGVMTALAVAYVWLWIAGLLMADSANPTAESIGRLLVKFALAGLNVVPFVPLIVLAQLGQSASTPRLLALGWWLLLAGMCWFIMVGLTIGAQTGLNAAHLRDAMPPGGWSRVAWAGGVGLAGILLGLICFSPALRRVAARSLPLDPSSFTDTTALATVVPLLIGCLIPLVVLGDAPILMMLRHAVPGLKKDALSESASVVDLYATLAWAVPISLLAAGFPLTRTLGGAFERLALVRPTGPQFLAAIAIAVGLVPVMLGFEAGSSWLWKQLGWPTTDTSTFEQMMKFAITPAGVVAVGVTAGVSEELAFRGLLQPRLGLLLSNLLFASVHAFQYHWDGVLGVFLIGLVCGLVRKYANTTSSMIVHGLYDAILMTIAVITQVQPDNVRALVGH